MAINANDLLTAGLKRFRAAAGGNLALPANTRIMGIAVTMTAGGTVRLDNATTAGAAADSIDIACVTGTSTYMRFGPNGTLFNLGVSTALTGTGSFTIFYLAE